MVKPERWSGTRGDGDAGMWVDQRCGLNEALREVVSLVDGMRLESGRR